MRVGVDSGDSGDSDDSGDSGDRSDSGENDDSISDSGNCGEHTEGGAAVHRWCMRLRVRDAKSMNVQMYESY